MCFNTFIQHIKAEKYRQFGFSFKLLNPIHWFQFADDAAVITGQESENQHLLINVVPLASRKPSQNQSNIFAQTPHQQ
jgi:hypothetical protein